MKIIKILFFPNDGTAIMRWLGLLVFVWLVVSFIHNATKHPKTFFCQSSQKERIVNPSKLSVGERQFDDRMKLWIVRIDGGWLYINNSGWSPAQTFVPDSLAERGK